MGEAGCTGLITAYGDAGIMADGTSMTRWLADSNIACQIPGHWPGPANRTRLEEDPPMAAASSKTRRPVER